MSKILHRKLSFDEEPDFMKVIRRLRAEGKCKKISHPPSWDPELYKKRLQHDAFCCMLVHYMRTDPKKIFRYIRKMWKSTMRKEFPEGGNVYELICEIRRKMTKGDLLKYYALRTYISVFKLSHFKN
jgi:hypothetical protein